MIGMTRWAIMFMLFVSPACARRIDDVTRAPDTQFARTMPNPDGCYLQVWDQPQYMGQSDYINGPREYANLQDMPNRLNWDRRIASVRVGATAIATAFTEQNFVGTSIQLGERREFPTLPDSVSRGVASLRIRCAAAPGDKK